MTVPEHRHYVWIFRVFERRNGRGRSADIKEVGETKINFKKVRSLMKIPCWDEEN